MSLPVLAASMIMKNESHNLDRCLSSIVDLVDFICIVDTGSTDNSIEIAEKYGAKVFKHPHTEGLFDFSKYRNISLDHCRELKADWVLIIDCDEALKERTTPPEEFKRRLTLMHPDVHSLQVICHEWAGGDDGFTFWGVRFFKLTPEFHYEGIVHNSPIVAEGKGSAGTNLTIYHYGYSDPEVMQNKRNRSLPLLDKRIKENPKDYDAMFYKIMILLGQGDFEKGIDCAEEFILLLNDAVDGDPDRMSFYGKIYAAMGSMYLRRWSATQDQKYGDRAYQWLSKGLESFPDDLDLNYLMTSLYWCAKDQDHVKTYGRKYKELLKEYREDRQRELPKFQNSLDMLGGVLTKRSLHTHTKGYESKMDMMMEGV